MKKTVLAVACALGAISTSSMAASIVADARSNAMGNTGVVSADYLLAPFHNPALGALHRENDDVGILIPAIGVNAHDKDESIQTIEDAQDLYDDRFANPGNITPADEAELNRLLDELDGNAPINVTGGVNLAVAIPSKLVAVNLFAGGFVEVVAGTEVGDGATAQERYEASTYKMGAFGVTEFGISLAKSFNLGGQDIAFGISPKFQELITYSQEGILDDFDLDNYDESEVSENAFNFDMGVAWHADEWRAGLALKNLLSQEIGTATGDYTYELSPQATLGLGYAGEIFSASVDFDLTKQERFKELDDDTRFLRFGVEANAWGWAQLRAGYEMDMEDTLDDSITAGIGISPFDVVSLDIAGSYAGENQFGASANLAFTF
ncbi:type IX secretion system membrane protein PorP/SprF [Vibrio ponticus]|uniref:Type IX secretion system membrane protein PorP/SprF n=1 Tax=Vibrio ponticus TaxID=265668 RepID=A0A3N3E667_9VIBR|nr:conjugal transfer protein TraF [Vibrio ponticus]ROV62100.1 type IX secretion system membrane protein PorP/SprF [Vibrio ponticus]